jgi:transcriptional accessory protein Tex/SPT6
LRVANINRQIAEELGVREQQVEATVALLDGGATVPFVAQQLYSITSSARATDAAGPCRDLDELFSQAAKTGAIGKARKAA